VSSNSQNLMIVGYGFWAVGFQILIFFKSELIFFDVGAPDHYQISTGSHLMPRPPRSRTIPYDNGKYPLMAGPPPRSDTQKRILQPATMANLRLEDDHTRLAEVI